MSKLHQLHAEKLIPMSRLRQLHAENIVLLPLIAGVIAGIICLVGALNRVSPGRRARRGRRRVMPLVETLNDPDLIAVVLFCLIGLLVVAGRLRWNEWYVAFHP